MHDCDRRRANPDRRHQRTTEPEESEETRPEETEPEETGGPEPTQPAPSSPEGIACDSCTESALLRDAMRAPANGPLLDTVDDGFAAAYQPLMSACEVG